MKLETLPPGQAATTIMPSAIEGGGARMAISASVISGRAIICAASPPQKSFGAERRNEKCAGFRPSAIANIMVMMAPASNACAVGSRAIVNWSSVVASIEECYPSMAGNKALFRIMNGAGRAGAVWMGKDRLTIASVKTPKHKPADDQGQRHRRPESRRPSAEAFRSRVNR